MTDKTTIIDTTVRHIGGGTILATSGGRVLVNMFDGTVTLPVSSGYRVAVKYDAGSDTYTVSRLLVRAGVVKDKGTATHIYADMLPDAVYRAGCYKNVEFGTA